MRRGEGRREGRNQEGKMTSEGVGGEANKKGKEREKRRRRRERKRMIRN